MSNRLVTEGLNALREAYNTLTTYTGQPRPYPKWGGDHATYMSSKDGKFNYVSSKDFKGADLQTPQGRIYYDKKSITMPSGQKITGTGRSKDVFEDITARASKQSIRPYVKNAVRGIRR